jgi:hypothetical protein
MSVSRTCRNMECLAAFVPNKHGATAKDCPRCYAYLRRNGELPGPKREVTPGRQISVRVPLDFEARVTRLSGLKPAAWARQVIEAKLEELELFIGGKKVD